jgi:hypothetical protein
MGRYKTGALTNSEVVRIELPYLLKHGLIKKGCHITGTLSWNNGNTIGIESDLTGGNRYLRLNYQNENRQTGEVTRHDYQIQLTSITSNLGIGEILYFVCPDTGHRARILYKCYGSLIWKSRFAYQQRIYYESQAVSKLDYHNTMYWRIDKLLDSIYRKAIKSHYREKETKTQMRIHYLESKRTYYDDMRYAILDKYFSIHEDDIRKSNPA